MASPFPGVLDVAVVTLFPELFDSFLSTGLLARALATHALQVGFHSPRQFVRNRHAHIDDSPYGGGGGMVMQVEPIVRALDHCDDPRSRHRILLTPQGRPLNQRMVCRLCSYGALSLLCGRYEGIDDRVRYYVDEEISLGDFVLLGGEIPAMALIEAMVRWVPGVLGNAHSMQDESHMHGLLEYPQYTRPPCFDDLQVPDLLLSGHHAHIKQWRHQQQQARTRAMRPDLWALYHRSDVSGGDSEDGDKD